MTYGEKRTKFTSDIALLIQRAVELGFEIRFVPEHSKHMGGSLHFIGLAKDFDLYKDGVYLMKTEDHLPLGEFWESLGNTWGGRWSDGNHYSIEHEKRK
jgi:hypothetical protein